VFPTKFIDDAYNLRPHRTPDACLIEMKPEAKIQNSGNSHVFWHFKTELS